MTDTPELIAERDDRIAVHFSSESNEWATPQELFDRLNAEFAFTLDPCSTHANAKCAKHFTRDDNGLLKSWACERVFCNPPYGREIGLWMAKAHDEATNHGALVVCLIPSRTDTNYWHDYAMPHEIRFIRGRVYFIGESDDRAPFPSAIVVMRPSTFRLTSF